MRFFDELKTPAKKCKRVGHKRRIREYSGYETTTSWRSVADDVSGKISYCTRCDEQFERTVEKRRGIQGLTMPSSQHEKLRENGFLEIR